MRNSSLVERPCAEDAAAANTRTEVAAGFIISGVGERLVYPTEGVPERSAGGYTRENAGMSSEKNSENLFHRKPKVS